MTIGVESSDDQLKEISEDVEGWDVRTPFGESSHIVETHMPYHTSNEDALSFASGLGGDKLISLAGYRHNPRPF